MYTEEVPCTIRYIWKEELLIKFSVGPVQSRKAVLFSELRMGQTFDALLEMVPQSVANYCKYNTGEALESVHCDPSVRKSRITFFLKLFNI